MLLCHLVQNAVCPKVVARNKINYEKRGFKMFLSSSFWDLGSLIYNLKNVYKENLPIETEYAHFEIKYKIFAVWYSQPHLMVTLNNVHHHRGQQRTLQVQYTCMLNAPVWCMYIEFRLSKNISSPAAQKKGENFLCPPYLDDSNFEHIWNKDVELFYF